MLKRKTDNGEKPQNPLLIKWKTNDIRSASSLEYTQKIIMERIGCVDAYHYNRDLETFLIPNYAFKALNDRRVKIKLKPLAQSDYHCSVCGKRNNPFNCDNERLLNLLRNGNMCKRCERESLLTED